jgi:hypothetical protein
MFWCSVSKTDPYSGSGLQASLKTIFLYLWKWDSPSSPDMPSQAPLFAFFVPFALVSSFKKIHVPIIFPLCFLKGAVAWDFCPLVLFINRPHLGLCFEFAELFEFEIRTALWATAENKFFCRCQGFKTWVVLALSRTVYIHALFSIHCPFKGYGKLLKTAV